MTITFIKMKDKFTGPHKPLVTGSNPVATTILLLIRLSPVIEFLKSLFEVLS
jgi:hypothetical protein